MKCLSCGSPEREHVGGICRRCGQPVDKQPNEEVTI